MRAESNIFSTTIANQIEMMKSTQVTHSKRDLKSCGLGMEMSSTHARGNINNLKLSAFLIAYFKVSVH